MTKSFIWFTRGDPGPDRAYTGKGGVPLSTGYVYVSMYLEHALECFRNTTVNSYCSNYRALAG